MDTTRDIIYRGFKLNDSTVFDNLVPDSDDHAGIEGCVVDSADMSDVDVVQFLEKRSQQDGMDAGDPFLGARRIRMAGTLYAKTRPGLYDAYWALRAALSPTLASREEPADKGYRPMYFSVPTELTEDYPSGVIPLRVLALPRASQLVFQRGQQGGDDTDPLAIPWQATFLMKDPSIQGEVAQDYAFADTAVRTGATASSAANHISSTAHGVSIGDRVYFSHITGAAPLAEGTIYYVIASGFTADTFQLSLTSGGAAIDITTTGSAISYSKVATQSGNFVNRGNYLAPLNMLIAVGHTGGTIVVAAGGSNFTITVPASTGARIIRYKGQDKVLTVEEEDIELLRMDLIEFQSRTTHPLIAPGTTAWSVTFLGVVVDAGDTDGSHQWFWEVRA